jgi:hypothetical protein
VIKALYLVEATAAVGLAVLAGRGVLWLIDEADSWPGPLWLCLPLVTLALGFVCRWRREVPLVSWLVGWNESIRRRMDERQP